MELLNTSLILSLTPVRGEGCWVWDEAGNRYLDLQAGTWCNVLGHAHPDFTRRVQAQLGRLVHVAPGAVTAEIRRACDRVGEILPAPLDRVTFLNSGSEAVELAIRLARMATGREVIASVREGFYGATNQALALSEAGRGAAYFLPGQASPRLPAPRCDRCPLGAAFPGCEFRCLTEWGAEMEGPLAGRVAAVLLEPVIATGIVVPPMGFVARAAGLAARWGALLIAEEVTTGVGRTGRWFGFEHDGVSPDIVVLGKALGNGLPVSAVATTAAVERACGSKLWHVQSHQNDPLSGAAATAVIEILRERGWVEHVRRMGVHLLAGLRRLQREHRGVREARGAGLMAALELEAEGGTERGARVQAFLRQKGILVDYRPATATFRFFPPYVIAADELDAALGALDEGLRATEALAQDAGGC